MKIGGKLAVAQGLLLLALGASFALGVSSQRPGFDHGVTGMLAAPVLP